MPIFCNCQEYIQFFSKTNNNVKVNHNLVSAEKKRIYIRQCDWDICPQFWNKLYAISTKMLDYLAKKHLKRNLIYKGFKKVCLRSAPGV